MTEDLRAPGFPDQVVVLKNSAMSLESGARLKWQNKMFMSQADKLGQVTVVSDGRGMNE